MRHPCRRLRRPDRRDGRNQRRDGADVQRVAVISGGSSGIGAAIARRLAGAGWHPVLLARGEERLRAVARETGGEYQVCDVADRRAVEEAAAEILRAHPRIELLVLNAGMPGRRGFLELEPEAIEQVARVNYLGSVWTLRAFLPGLEAHGAAHVVSIVSVAGTVAAGPSGPYSASKHAQLAFSRSLVAELAPRGVRVHVVNPGFVETPGFPQRSLLRNPLLRRIVIGPERVADHVAHVLERNRTETCVPAFYRVASLAQALAPGLLARTAARWRPRRDCA